MSRVCEREEAVVRSALHGGPSGALEAHVSECPECRETMAITVWMRDAAGADREAVAEGLPDASEIWRRAEVLARVDRRYGLVERAVRPIAVFERWMGAAVAVVLAVLVWLQADRLFDGAWAAEVGEMLVDPDWIARVGAAAVAILAASTGVLVERLRDV